MTTLSAQQEQAVKVCVDRLKGLITPEPLTYVAGFAGTGKSTILPFILDSLGFNPETVSFVAPTGKAAKVMRAKLRDQGYTHSSASTIHSAIYRAKPKPVEVLERELAEKEGELQALEKLSKTDPTPKVLGEAIKMRKLCATLRHQLEEAYSEKDLSFQLNPDSAIQMSKLIVVDEASMVGARMAEDLMSFGVPVLAMGDPGQLPPVKDEEGLTAGEPDFFLSEIHRQAADNPIIWLSKLAREGKELPMGKHGDTVEILKRKDYDPVLDFDERPMFLVGTNKTRWRYNQMLREEFGYAEDVRDRVGPQEGEPLIICKNVRDQPTLVNGAECIALSDVPCLEQGESRFELSFEDEEGATHANKQVFQGLFEEHFARRAGGFTCSSSEAFRARKRSIQMDWAYAITVHKSQGSQWDDVVVADESSVFGEDMDKHLYTAVTRAAKTLKVLV